MQIHGKQNTQRILLNYLLNKFLVATETNSVAFRILKDKAFFKFSMRKQ